MDILAAASASPNAIWYLMRGSGIVSVTMLTIVSVLGIATTMNWSFARLPRFATQALHRSLSLGALIFLAIHVITAVADTFVSVSLIDIIVPFGSSYKPLYIGLGTLVVDLMLMLILTSLLRAHIGIRLWRVLHWAAYICLPLALVHALLIGSDTSRTWLEALYAGEALVAVGGVIARASTKQEPTAQERFDQTTKFRNLAS